MVSSRIWLNEPGRRAATLLRTVWSVAEFVEWRFAPAWRNGQTDAASAPLDADTPLDAALLLDVDTLRDP